MPSANFQASALWPGASNAPKPVNIPGSNKPVIGWAFGDAATMSLYTEEFYLASFTSGTFTAIIHFYSTATTNNARFEASIQCQTAGDSTSVEAKSFATASQVTQAASSAVSKGPQTATITGIANDGAATGDRVVAKISRLGADGADNLSGDVIITGVTITWT